MHVDAISQIISLLHKQTMKKVQKICMSKRELFLGLFAKIMLCLSFFEKITIFLYSYIHIMKTREFSKGV